MGWRNPSDHDIRAKSLQTCMVSLHGQVVRCVAYVTVRVVGCDSISVPLPASVDSESLSELESMDPQKRELLEARFLGKVSRGEAPVISVNSSFLSL